MRFWLFQVNALIELGICQLCAENLERGLVLLAFTVVGTTLVIGILCECLADLQMTQLSRNLLAYEPSGTLRALSTHF